MLTIYRASAGAGKTHKLTGEYLMLLFSQPGEYRRILAVTFTNKATDEMKTRIVEELYALSAGKKSDYLSMLSEAYQLTEQQVREQAKRILIAILHDYSAFNISTIDRFFQQTMRAFTREIGLQGGYGVEMDGDRVLMEAIDQMLADLDKSENKELLGWLLRFAENKVEDGKGWNLRKDIQSLSGELFKESYRAFSAELEHDIADKKSLDAYKKTLHAIVASVEAEAKRLGEEGLEIIHRFGLEPTDFKGGLRSSMLIFEKLGQGTMKTPTATFRNMVDVLDNYSAKTAKPDVKAQIESAYHGGLNACVKKVVDFFDHLSNYNTAKAIDSNFYTLGILSDVSKQIAAYREENNVLLIADTTELLNKVISGSDAPFIYEKTGTHVDHYMIDEFQDTSGMQWDNFRPLVDESLGHGRDNLIVGDVKQSIYRFRNSDWKLLDEQVRYDFEPAQVREETLKDNWRSCRHIVEFNNAFFTVAPMLLQAMYNESLENSSLSEEEQAEFSTKIMSAYDKSFQRVPKPFQQKDGHVQVRFVDAEGSDFKDDAVELLPETLQQLQDQGYELKDIAILVRKNKEAALVANTLLTYKEEHPDDGYKYDIVSDEALFISSSFAVRFLVATLRYLRNPEDRTNKMLALYAYQLLTNHFGEEIDSSVFDELHAVSRQSLYELVEELTRRFIADFPLSEQVFVQAFMDMVSAYVQKESADVNRFLKWWDETGCNKTIATPDGQNAIRILTVHKSKGLGFKVVLIPFCNWEIDHKPKPVVTLWCQPKVKPFDGLHLVPVNYSATLGDTIFAYDYFKERLHAFIDNLNTLYVAFTRSKEELIVFAPVPSKITKEGKAEKISSVGDLLWNGVSMSVPDTREGDALVPLEDFFKADQDSFEMGNWWKPSCGKESSEVEEVHMSSLRSVSPDDRLQLRLHGKGFFFDNAQRKRGTLMHEVLSRVRVPKDLPISVEAYRLAGVINREEATELVTHLEKLLNDPRVADWYDGTTRVLNEVDILFGKGLTKRPDRVMIKGDEAIVVDYKFGERQLKSYHKQVEKYMQLIRKMGYKKVSGYLWYVELGEIQTVEGQ